MPLQSNRRWSWSAVNLLGLVGAIGVATQATTWSPSLTTGPDPVALVRIPDGVAVVCRGPHPETLRQFERELQTRIAGASGTAKGLLEKVLNDLKTTSTVLVLRSTPDGALWPNREILLYELAQVYSPGAPSLEKTERVAGVATAAVYIRKETSDRKGTLSDVLLVATNGPVWELNLNTGVLRVAEGLPRNVVAMALGDLVGDGQQELVLISEKTVSVYRVVADKFELWRTWQGGPGSDLGFNPSFVSVADLDGDGAADIVVASDGEAEINEETGEVRRFRDRRIYVILSQRKGFSAPRSYDATARPRSVVVADFSGDGWPDVVVAGAEAVVLLEGTGNGRLGEPHEVRRWASPNETVPGTSTFRLPPAALAAVDLDRSGTLSLVIGDPATGKVMVHYGPYVSKAFSESQEIFTGTNLKGVLVYSYSPVDYPDLLVADGGTQELYALVQHSAGFARLPNPRQGIGGSLSVSDGGSRAYLGVLSGLLEIRSAPQLTITTRQYPRPAGLSPDEETKVERLFYTFYESTAPSVDPLVAAGGGVAGTPARAGESGDGSLAIVYDRVLSPGTRAEDNFPRFGAGAPLPRGAVFGALKSDDPPDAVVVFVDGAVWAMESPWPKRAGSRKIDIPSLPTGVSAAIAVLAGLDGARKDDLVVIDRKTADVYVLLNGRAPWIRYAGRGVGPVGLVAQDLDGDGNVDLAIVNAYSNDLSILWGRGDGTFGYHPESVPVGLRPVALAAAKGTAPGAGAVLVVANSGSDTVSVIEFSGRTPRVRTTLPLGRTGPLAVASGESLDWLARRPRDGYADFVVACYAADELVLLLGREGGGFDVVPIDGGIRMSNIVGFPVSGRGHGPLSVVVADLDGDGDEDLAFSVTDPLERLQLDPSRVAANFYAAPVRTELEKLWQAVFIYSSRLNGITVAPPVPERAGIDVSVGRDAGGPVLAVLHSDAAGGVATRRVSFLGLQPGSAGWRVIQQLSVDPAAASLLATDLNCDQRLDLVVLDPTGNKVEVYWQALAASPARTLLDGSAAPAALAAGSSCRGSWLLAGERLWAKEASAPGFGTPRDLILDGAVVRAATAVPARNGHDPPDLLLVTTRNEIYLIQGTEIISGSAMPSFLFRVPSDYVVSSAVGGYLDPDPYLDVVITSSGGGGIGQVRLGGGKPGAQGTRELASASAVGIGDLDGDGIDDVVALAATAGTRLAGLRFFAGKGDGGFLPPSATWFAAEAPWEDSALTVADLDGDRRPEVVVWDRQHNTVLVFWIRDSESEFRFGGLTLATKRMDLGLWSASGQDVPRSVPGDL